jgi:hypothetical protein
MVRMSRVANGAFAREIAPRLRHSFLAVRSLEHLLRSLELRCTKKGSEASLNLEIRMVSARVSAGKPSHRAAGES